MAAISGDALDESTSQRSFFGSCCVGGHREVSATANLNESFIAEALGEPVKESNSPGCGRMTGNPEVIPR
jgi:hypothetical protein